MIKINDDKAINNSKLEKVNSKRQFAIIFLIHSVKIAEILSLSKIIKEIDVDEDVDVDIDNEVNVKRQTSIRLRMHDHYL